MPRIPRFRALIALTVVLLVSTPVMVAHDPAAAAGPAPDFTLSATIVGLYPGADLDRAVTVHNPMPFAIAVRSASAVVGDASSTCPATNLHAAPFAGDVVVAAHATGTVPVRMHMAATASDACQGATFPLTFTAYGSPVPAATVPGAADPGGAGAAGFAFTGTDPHPLVVIGVGALCAGLVLVARRRRASGRDS